MRLATGLDKTTYDSWIGTYILNRYNGRPMQVGDLIIDEQGLFLDDLDTNATLNASYTAASNTSGSSTFVVNEPVSTDHLSEGTFRVDNGGATTLGFDQYHYSSYDSGTKTFTLDVTDHPSGLLRTYSGSEQTYVTYLPINFNIWYAVNEIGVDVESHSTTGVTSFISTTSSTGSAHTWKYQSTKGDRVRIFPLGGQLVFKPNVSNGRFLEIGGIEHIEYDPTINGLFDGFRNPFANSNFLHRSFGAIHWGYNDNGILGILIEPGEGATTAEIVIRNVELCACVIGNRLVQAGGDATDVIPVDIHMDDVYLHDVNSEGNYINTTGGSFQAKIEMVSLANNLMARCGREVTQIQDMVTNSKRKYISNNVGIFGGAAYLEPGQSFHENGWQLYHGDGNFMFTKNITEGWQSSGIIIFGTNTGGGVGTVYYKDNVFKGGNRGVLLHGSLAGLTGIDIKFLRTYFLDKADRKTGIVPKATETTHVFSQNNGDVGVYIQDLYKDISYPTMFEDATGFMYLNEGVDNTLDGLDWIAPGFGYEVDGSGNSTDFVGMQKYIYLDLQDTGRQITHITDNGLGEPRITTSGLHGLTTGDSYVIKDATSFPGYNTYYPNAVTVIDTTTLDLTGATYLGEEGTGASQVAEGGKPITYKNGQTVSDYDATKGKAFWKYTADQEMTAFDGPRPKDNPNCTRLYWDVNGVRSDDPSYTGTPDPSTGGYFPPDKYFLPSTNEWTKRGYGLLSNPSNQNKYQWQIQQNGNWVDIPGYLAKRFVFDSTKYIDDLTGESIRLVITFRNSVGGTFIKISDSITL